MQHQKANRKKKFEKRDRFTECLCVEEHEAFAVTCFNCKYDAKGFGRNYFASTKCFCYATNKSKCCSHSLTLKMILNTSVNKVCIDSEAKTDLELIPIKHYLIKKRNVSLFFVFCKNDQMIKIRIDYDDIFVDLETM